MVVAVIEVGLDRKVIRYQIAGVERDERQFVDVVLRAGEDQRSTDRQFLYW
jgi:hypothetical protein